MHTKKTTIFIKTKKAKHIKLNSYSSPKDQLLGRSGAHLWDGKQKRILLQANTQNVGQKTGSKFLILGIKLILAMLFPLQLFFFFFFFSVKGLPDGSDGKESACTAGDLISILWSGRSPGKGNGYPLQ